MDNEVIIHEEFYLSWLDEEGHLYSRSYSRPKDAKRELAQMQGLGNKYPIHVSVTQTRIVDLLEVAIGDTADYSGIFNRPLDN